jgi:hypothetical protein
MNGLALANFGDEQIGLDIEYPEIRLTLSTTQQIDGGQGRNVMNRSDMRPRAASPGSQLRRANQRLWRARP